MTFEGEEANHTASAKNMKFWRYIHNQKTTKAGIPPLKKNGRLFSKSNPQRQAAILNEQFQSAFSEGKEYLADEFESKTGMHHYGGPSMENISITEEGVKKLLRNLNPNKAGGPDGIGPRVLCELTDEVAPALVTLF